MLLNEDNKMYYPPKINGNKTSIFIIIFMFIVIIPATAIIVLTTTTTNNPVYGQQPDKTNFNTTDSSNIQSIPAKKVQVGDIETAYKMLGKGDPILLYNGASDGMDAWDPSLLRILSSNHTVIAFDTRGIANTTIGSKPYTYQQLATDAAGLLDALKIPKADVMGYSLGSYIAQQITIMYPDKVNTLTLIGSSCGGKDHTPKPAEFLKMQAEVVNKSLNNIPYQEEMKELITASVGVGWIKLHPEVLENIPTDLMQTKPGLTPEVMNNQNNVGKHWEDNPNWSGACDELAKLAKPTLVITGMDDNKYQPHVNSLKIAEKIPGAWLVQIKNAGHAAPDQYPEEMGKIINTFLSTTAQTN